MEIAWLFAMHATLPKRKLVGENGICEAVNAIGREIRGLSYPLKGVEELVLGRRKRVLGKSSHGNCCGITEAESV